MPVFFNKLFFRVVLTNPIFSLKNAFLFLSDYFQYQSRVKKVLHRCQKDKVKTVMIWGANNYAKLLMLNFNQQINVINIIDSKVALSHSQLLGVNITAFRTITRNELDNVDAIILATDNHQRSMKRELSKVAPTLLVKVIEF